MTYKYKQFMELIAQKIIDENFINDILHIYIADNKLKDFVKEINIDDTSIDIDFMLGSYNFVKQTLNYNLTAVLKYEMSQPTFISMHEKSEEAGIVYLYYEAFKHLFHELTHAKQIQELNSKRNIFKRNLYFQNYMALKTNWDLYHEFHNYYPIEHEADAKGIIISLDTLKKYDYYFEAESYLICSGLLNYYELNDDILTSPSDMFYKINNIKQEDNKMNLYNRLLLGLPIKREEYKEIINIRDGIIKTDDIVHYIKKMG